MIFLTSLQGSSNLVALSFSDLFPCSMDDLVPVGVGPHLLFSYIDQWYAWLILLFFLFFLFCFDFSFHKYSTFLAHCKSFVILSHSGLNFRS